MKIAVIPARGGSKRIPGKNIRDFCGKPMIAWAIEAALGSGCFDRVIVSTDDAKIASLARDYGASTPFVRPTELSGDHTGTGPVMQHAIQWLAGNGLEVSLVCCLYATAPFVRSGDLRKGLEALQDTRVQYALAVTSYGFPIQRALRMNDSGRLTMMAPEHFLTRSQDLEAAWHDAGQFCWGRSVAWLGGLPVFGSDTAAVVLPRHRVQDVDTEEDWERAQWLFRALSGAT